MTPANTPHIEALNSLYSMLFIGLEFIMNHPNIAQTIPFQNEKTGLPVLFSKLTAKWKVKNKDVRLSGLQ